MLARIDPEAHQRLSKMAQADIDERWHLYEQMAGVERSVPGMEEDAESTNGTGDESGKEQ